MEWGKVMIDKDNFMEKVIIPLLAIRMVAKESKNFKIADMLRDYLKECWRFQVIDTQSSVSGYFID